MFYDIRTTPAQIIALARWVHNGSDAAAVELVVDDRMLLAEQADERMAWDTDGSEATARYLTRAPVEPNRNAIADRTLHTIARALQDAGFATGALTSQNDSATEAGTNRELDRYLVGEINAKLRHLLDRLPPR